ncbi:histidine kinase [Altererythrobacter xixiisoli]|uniref:histidine kinase n=1 Tax=Croceibacterium xixiisoli TaxID=1476466 RepID=A0A6I4TS26_9SPHN|nr:histidine kinase [Croceibacterium xixiisoli]
MLLRVASSSRRHDRWILQRASGGRFDGGAAAVTAPDTARRRRVSAWLTRYPRATPVAIFLLIAAITILGIFAIEWGEGETASADLRSRANNIASGLERRSDASSAYLRAGAALLASVDRVEPASFRRFVSELRLDSDFRGAEGIGWGMIVRRGGEGAFGELMLAENNIAVGVRPAIAAPQSFAVPVTIIEPDSTANRNALGFDMYSDPVRRAAMDQAARTLRPVASSKVMLVRGDNSETTNAGFLIYMPVFEASPGRPRLRGYIFSPFDAQDFLASALEVQGAESLAVKLYSGSSPSAPLLASINSAEDGRKRVVQRVNVGGQEWRLEVSSRDSRMLSGLSMLTLIFGALVAGLLMVVVRMLTRQAQDDERRLAQFEEQASIRNSLTRELNHRVKNSLASVLSIIALTRRRSKTLDEFADGLDGRIRALSATHDLLTQSDWGTTPVRAVVETELRPYANASDHEIVLNGPEISLAPNDALSLGLATHELATNAAKYGALSQAGGTVSVSWELVGEGKARIVWKESGGPPVPEQRGRGFGTDLIERVVANELKTPVELDFPPDGVRCVLQVLVREHGEFAIRAGK